MYGNHSSHTSGFQNSDLGAGGYPSPTTTDLYFDGGDSQSAIYYGPGQPTPTAPFPENRIISADNGLSYTNLDYAMYHQGQDCADGAPGYLAHHHDTKLHLHRYGASAAFAGSIADDAVPSDNHHHHHHLPQGHLHHHPHIAHPSNSNSSPGANGGAGGGATGGGGGGGSLCSHNNISISSKSIVSSSIPCLCAALVYLRSIRKYC
uniref:Uncharacterized protein n=1 Tax=Anopheles farauti TaxID=69004 RepID=A0A182QA99_9DIPT